MSTSDRTIHTATADIRIRETDGTGMPLLMIHGSGASKDVFRQQMDSALGDMFRMIAIDLPGHGESSNAADPATEYTLSGLARTMGAVIDELRLERTAVLGWSLGGHIAVELMATRKDIAGLMLCATAPLSHSVWSSYQAFRTNMDTLLARKEKYSERDAQRLLRLCFGDSAEPGYMEAINRADGRLRPVVVKSMLQHSGVDQKRAIEAATIPIAFVNGADEPMVKLSYVERLRCPTLWENRTHLVPGAGHTPFVQAPQQFNVLLHRFMHDLAIGRALIPADELVSRTA